MKIKKVAKMNPVDRFLYWIQERHKIYEKKEIGEPKPWTNDEVLQNYFFTNPYRENDKVTKWFKKNIRENYEYDPQIIFATILFRWFNFIPTGQLLIKHDLLSNWHQRNALKVLGSVRDKGGQVFTGAFMINSPGGEPKLEAICRRVNNVWLDRDQLLLDMEELESLKEVHNRLTQYKGLGGFMAYEVVTDLRHTYLLRSASDINTWCNPGPGCIRGLHRISGQEIKNKSNASSPPKPKDWLDRMKKLLAITNKRLSTLPTFEMREVEHALCEFDKYERARTGDGRMKRKYKGV